MKGVRGLQKQMHFTNLITLQWTDSNLSKKELHELSRAGIHEINKALCFLAYFVGRSLLGKLADEGNGSFPPVPSVEIQSILTPLLGVLAFCGPHYILRLHWLRDLGVSGRSTRKLARILLECVIKAKRGTALSSNVIPERQKTTIAKLPQRFVSPGINMGDEDVLFTHTIST